MEPDTIEFIRPMVVYIAVQFSYYVILFILKRFKNEQPTKTKLPDSNGIDRREK